LGGYNPYCYNPDIPEVATYPLIKKRVILILSLDKILPSYIRGDPNVVP